ncbi:MAG: UbiA prenyltransferase family protein [Filifactor alocis]|nr:UbiA prenyltransferase family protein [Filifactor alocis]
MRVKHYIKNLLICVPLVFSKKLFQDSSLFHTLLGVLAFSMVSSVIYIINDINDIERDRSHPKKKERPLAKGTVTIRSAVLLILFLFSVTTLLEVFVFKNSLGSWAVLFLYFFINVAYSYRLKNIPIVDVVILAMGYILRIYYGAVIVNVEVSAWLYLTVLSLAFFLGFGKRRNELIKRGTSHRAVLKYYTKEYLDKVMYIFLGITLVFYSLWCEGMVSMLGRSILFTIPVVILVILRYTLVIEMDSDGDPVEVVLGDKIIIILSMLYIVMILTILYIKV